MDLEETNPKVLGNEQEIKLLSDDSYFRTDGDFNLDVVIEKLEIVLANINDNFKPFNYLAALWEVTKYFKECGACLSYASDDVRAKINIVRTIYKKDFPEVSTIQELIEEERKLGIHVCNSENNEKVGFKKGNKYHRYESGNIFN